MKEEPTVTQAVSELPRGWFPSLALADGRALKVFSLHTNQESSGLYDQRTGALALIGDKVLLGYGDATALTADLHTHIESGDTLDPATLRITAHPTCTPPREPTRWSLSRPSFHYQLDTTS